MQELAHVHKTFHGLSDEEAELEFIKEAQKLQEYGIHFYKVQRRTLHTGGAKVNASLMITNHLKSSTIDKVDISALRWEEPSNI